LFFSLILANAGKSGERDGNDAANFATALAMAIQGMDRLAVEEGQEKLALERLADEVRFEAHKARELWYQAHEASGDDKALRAVG
jgi:hypothetical protein